jgi:uncharacterized membrane protein YfcA
MSLAGELLLLGVGFVAGIIGALAGVGGGIIITPVLSANTRLNITAPVETP